MSEPQEKKSLLDLCYDFFMDKIKDGYVVSDEKTGNELRNLAQKQFQIKRGSMTYTTKALVKALKDSNLQVPTEFLERSSGTTLQIKIPKAPLDDKIKDLKPNELNPHGTLPSKELGTTAETKIDTLMPKTAEQIKEEREKYERIFSRGFDFIPELYEKLGLIKGTPKPKTEQEFMNQSQKFREDVSKYSKDVANYCYDNKVPIPTWLEFVALLCGGIITLGKPIIDTMIEPLRQDQQDTRKSDNDLLQANEGT
jgi:hypothetical protein